MDDFGGRLRGVRNARAMTVPQMARRLFGESATPEQIRNWQNYVSRIERGQETNPSLDKIEQLAVGMGMKAGEFLSELEAHGTRQTNPDKSSPSIGGITAPPLGHGGEGDPLHTTIDHPLAEAGHLLISAGDRLLAAAHGIHLDRAHSTVRQAGAAKSKGGARRARNQ